MYQPNSASSPQGAQDLSLSRILNKERRDISREDLARFIIEHDVEMINLRFVAGDGRLKTFNYVADGPEQVDRLLAAGGRVDGSSLFPLVDAGSSDLYIIPRYNTAFINPFTPYKTLDLLCSFFTNTGEPLPGCPENVVRRAHRALRQETGYSMETLAELEYYVIFDGKTRYPGTAQRGYGESPPFARFETLRTQAMYLLAQMGYRVKYGHSEVGKVAMETQGLEQAEIEFDLAPIEDSADAVVVGQWVLRMLAAQAGVDVTFAPKLLHGHAGSGLHVHSRLVKDGRNAICDPDGLNENAHKLIAGFLSMAPSLSAFGNPIPVSYLRLVPNQEAPVYVCWGERNRSSLVRIPLSWTNVQGMASKANPHDPDASTGEAQDLTLEFRSPDGSADVHFLHAGLAVAARVGLSLPDAMEISDRLCVESNIFKPERTARREQLPRLPASCAEAAQALLRDRTHYEEHGVFTPRAVDGVADRLARFGEEEERCRMADFEELNKIIAQYLHYP